jgi:hypothetical protein
MPRPSLASAALLFAAVPALAQPVQSLARVKVGSAGLYSGPGDQMPKCGSIEQGHVVVVDHPEGNDWLAVQPPVGSLSWINHLHVELQTPPAGRPVTFPANAQVRSAGEVKLAVGQMGDAKPFNVRRTKLPDGSVVKIVGEKVRATADGDYGESSWYPIIPPRDDFRYVRRADVELIGGSEKPGFVVKAASHTEPAEPPVASIPGTFRPAAPASGDDGSNNPLWKDAEAARRENDFPRAERLYKQVAEEATRGGDTALANLCFNRIHYLRELQRQKERGETPVLKALTIDPPADATKPTGAATVGGRGLLRVVDFKYENRPVYALTDQRGVSLYLVSDVVDLSRYNRRHVELSGTVTYPKEFAGTGLMRVSTVDKVEGK